MCFEAGGVKLSITCSFDVNFEVLVTVACRCSSEVTDAPRLLQPASPDIARTSKPRHSCRSSRKLTPWMKSVSIYSRVCSQSHNAGLMPNAKTKPVNNNPTLTPNSKQCIHVSYPALYTPIIKHIFITSSPNHQLARLVQESPPRSPRGSPQLLLPYLLHPSRPTDPAPGTAP